jgi:hypothetical protein
MVRPMSVRPWAFDQDAQAGFTNGSTAALPPSNVASLRSSAPY